MLVDRQSTPWIVVCVILLIIATAAFIHDRTIEAKGPTGGSVYGLVFGIAGTAMMAFAMLLALKKRLRTLRVGRAYTWMQGHIWLSLLSYPLILYHAGFHWGQPWNLTWVMMWVFTIVVLSGIFGVVIQNIVPTKMLDDVQLETIYDQIDHVIRQLAHEAEALAINASAMEDDAYVTDVLPAGSAVIVAAPANLLAIAKRRFADFYEAQVRPYLASPRGRGLTLTTPSRAAAAFDDIRRALPPSMRQELDDIESITNERRQLERQRSLHHWLHSWLLVHVPLSYALTVLAVVHIVVALRFRP